MARSSSGQRTAPASPSPSRTATLVTIAGGAAGRPARQRRGTTARSSSGARTAPASPSSSRTAAGSCLLAVLPDGRLASAGLDGQIKLWPKDGTGEPVVLAHGSFPVTSLAVLPDGRLASGGLDGQIKLWPKDGTDEPGVLVHGRLVSSLAVLPDGRLASGGLDGQIKLWPKDGRGEPVVLTHGSQVTSLAVLPDGRLASGGLHGQIKLWPKDGKGEPSSSRTAMRSRRWRCCRTGGSPAGARWPDQALACRARRADRCPLPSRRPQSKKGRVGPLHWLRYSLGNRAAATGLQTGAHRNRVLEGMDATVTFRDPEIIWARSALD